MCNCVDVDIGSYGNQICVVPPDCVILYLNEPEKRQRLTVCLDLCLVEEVVGLWNKGITTTGSCCGHNKMFAYIGVNDSCIEDMKEMGYEVCPNHIRSGEDSFYPKSVNPLKHLNPAENIKP